MTSTSRAYSSQGRSHHDFDAANSSLDYDVLIIGAGLSGIYSLQRMRKLGLRAKVLEAGSGEGGTWFW
jgi:cation diffusion facilitator CzcD-associated flavoprotein CzcO